MFKSFIFIQVTTTILALFSKTAFSTFTLNQTDPETNKPAIQDFFDANSTAFKALPANCQSAFYTPIDCDIDLLSLNPISKSFNYRIRSSDYESTCTDNCRTSVAQWSMNLTQTCGTAINNSTIFTQTGANSTQAQSLTSDLAFRLVYAFACFKDTADNGYCGNDYPKLAAEVPVIVLGLTTSSGRAGNTSSLCTNNCLLQYLDSLDQAPQTFSNKFANTTKIPSVGSICPSFNASTYPLLASAAVIAANTSANTTKSFGIRTRDVGSVLGLLSSTLMVSLLITSFIL